MIPPIRIALAGDECLVKENLLGRPTDVLT
jgi:hypothetical protein